MDQELIKKVKNKLSRTTKKTHHTILQIHTALQQYEQTGKSKEVLQHYLNNKPSNKVYYFEGKVFDFTDQKITMYSRANRHNEWLEVKVARIYSYKH